MPEIKKYGLIPAGEIVNWNIGPYCDQTSCTIPWGVSVGNNDGIPVEVFISFHQGQVTEIDVFFGESYWNEVLPILDKKYGPNWEIERDPNMGILDYETKKRVVMERVTLTHREGGINAKTRDTCEIWATNLDLILYHHDPLGPFHSELVIKLVSKNF